MDWRRDELARFGAQLALLDDAEAARVYETGMSLTSKSHYGLDKSKFDEIESLDVDETNGAADWLAQRIGNGWVLVVFDKRNVGRMSASVFIENWRDWLLPSRDDAVILPECGIWALFYCHEDEFEFGRRFSG